MTSFLTIPIESLVFEDGGVGVFLSGPQALNPSREATIPVSQIDFDENIRINYSANVANWLVKRLNLLINYALKLAIFSSAYLPAAKFSLTFLKAKMV